jgi:hypothetical protein
MKRIALVLLLVAALAPSAMAGPVGQVQVGYAGSPYGPYQTGQGGEFTLNALSPSGLDTSGYAAGVTGGIGGLAGTFQTFCIEGNEYIAGYDTIYNASLDTYAEAGGQTGATAGKDPVSAGTGWLYSQFAQGTLDYNYDGGTDAQIAARRVSAGLLQDALWWLEGEMGRSYDATNIFMLAVWTAFGGEIGARADGAATYGVYALNIWTADGVRAQTQLFYVPDGGTTLMLLGGALVGLGALRRKFGR